MNYSKYSNDGLDSLLSTKKDEIVAEVLCELVKRVESGYPLGRCIDNIIDNFNFIPGQLYTPAINSIRLLFENGDATTFKKVALLLNNKPKLKTLDLLQIVFLADERIVIYELLKEVGLKYEIYFSDSNVVDYFS